MSGETGSVTLPPDFRQEGETSGMPAAGVALLVALVAAAVWAVWFGRRRPAGADARAVGTRAWLPTWGDLRGARRIQQVQVLDSTALAGGARLQVVSWEGRRYLLATSAQGVPLLVDREPRPGGTAGEPGNDRGGVVAP